MIFRPIVLQFNPFPFYPLNASQAGLQKTSQICALLPQVASLDDLNHVSDIILMTSSCMRHYVGDILTPKATRNDPKVTRRDPKVTQSGQHLS